MTRINLIPAKLLLDQHLLAEKKEINQLAGQMQRSLRSPNFDYYLLPDTYTLGKGHVKFWYRYGAYIRYRYREIYKECLRRNFDVQDNFNDEWSKHGDHEYNLDFEPSEGHVLISKDRILRRFDEKPNFYRYFGKPVNPKSYRWALRTDNVKWIKERGTE